jgi:cytochrome P450
LSKTYEKFEKGSLQELASEITIESLENAPGKNYLKMVMNESLRIEPPVPLSTSFCMTEDIEIAGIPVKKGQMMQINIYKLHHNED